MARGVLIPGMGNLRKRERERDADVLGMKKVNSALCGYWDYS